MRWMKVRTAKPGSARPSPTWTCLTFLPAANSSDSQGVQEGMEADPLDLRANRCRVQDARASGWSG